MARPSDREIEEKATNALCSDPRVDPGEITLSVTNGVVHLAGVVDSAAEKRAAQEDIRAAVEVERIVDQLELRNFISRSDEELRQAVRQALIRDISVDARPIIVDTREGVVTLKGSVSSFAQRSAAENVAWWTPGVIDVVDKLQVDGLCDLSGDTDC